MTTWTTDEPTALKKILAILNEHAHRPQHQGDGAHDIYQDKSGGDGADPPSRSAGEPAQMGSELLPFCYKNLSIAQSCCCQTRF
mgnify:CR=1 FL=1